MIITTRGAGSKVQVTTPDGEQVTADLTELPSGDARTAVVFPARAGIAVTCDPPTGQPSGLRVDVLDAAGQVTRCIGGF